MKSKLFALALICASGAAQAQALTAETLTGWCQDARETFTGIVGTEPLLRTDQRRSNATACAAYLRGWLEHEAQLRARSPEMAQCTQMPKDNGEMIGTFLSVAERNSGQTDLNSLMNNFGGKYCPPIMAAAKTQIQPDIMMPMTAPVPQAQIDLPQPATPPQTTIAPQITAEAPKPQADVTQYVIIPRTKAPEGNTKITEVGDALVQVPLVPEATVAETAPKPIAQKLPEISPEETFAPAPQVNLAEAAPAPKTWVSDMVPQKPAEAPQMKTVIAELPPQSAQMLPPLETSAPQPRTEIKTAERIETPPLAVDLSQYPLKPETGLPEIKTAAVQPPPMQMPQPASVKALAEPAPLPVPQATPKLTPPALTPEQETSKLIASLAEPTAKMEIKATKPITTPMALKSPVVSNEPPPLLISSKQLRKLEKHEQAKIQIIQ